MEGGGVFQNDGLKKVAINWEKTNFPSYTMPYAIASIDWPSKLYYIFNCTASPGPANGLEGRTSQLSKICAKKSSLVRKFWRSYGHLKFGQSGLDCCRSLARSGPRDWEQGGLALKKLRRNFHKHRKIRNRKTLGALYMYTMLGNSLVAAGTGP
jgi:hypothetical protein